MQQVQLLASQVNSGSFSEFIEKICSLASQKDSSYVCFANVHMLVEAYDDPSFNQVLQKAALVTPDGMPLAKLMKWRHKLDQERVAGMDVVPVLFKEASERGLRIFMLGDTEELLEELENQLAIDFPRLVVAGSYSPPFRNLSDSEKEEVIHMVNEAKPDLLLVALGCPKQEKWMAEHTGKIQATMLGIGNALRTYLGKEKRAPIWMQKMALEWLYRLLQNPGRLWKRYFITNGKFILLNLGLMLSG
ncbi:MAG: WecB/TagA/CpsF family glycosyltransferase, partial [Bacteroidota bacterium]